MAHAPKATSAFRHAAPLASAVLLAVLAVSAQANEQEARSAEALVNQSQQLLQHGDRAGARAALSQASRLGQGDTQRVMQAVIDDADGMHGTARSTYDALLQSSPQMRAAIAVPSAVNLVALGRYDEARTAFEAIAERANAYDAGYAQLWLLRLAAQEYRAGETPSALKLRLQAMAEGARSATLHQQEILELYQGRATVDQVYTTINAMPVANDMQRRDALAEATLFAGAYLQYVENDIPGARDLYERGYTQASEASVERPLIDQARKALPPSSSR